MLFIDLGRAKAIDSAQYEGLSKLIEQGNKEVAGIFGRYEENKDVYALIDALKSINIGANKAQPSTLPGQVRRLSCDNIVKYHSDLLVRRRRANH